METLKSLRDWVIQMIEDESINSQIDIWIRDAVDVAQKLVPWDALRQEEVITLTNGALTFPPLCRTMTGMWLSNGTTVSGDKVYRRSERYRDTETRFTRPYYIPNGIKMTTGTTYAGTQSGGATAVKGTYVLNQVDSDVANAWPTASDIGKQLIIEGGDTRYKITGVVEDVGSKSVSVYPSIQISTNYAASFEVDPIGQEQYSVYDKSDVLYNGDIYMEYQMDHPTLANDSDPILIPAGQTIRILCLQHGNRQNKYDVDAERLRVDLEQMMRLEVFPEGEDEEINLPTGFGGGPPMFSHQSMKRGGGAFNLSGMAGHSRRV